MSAIAWLWLKSNWRMALAGSAALFVVGFILMALHWKAEAEKQREAAEAAKQEARGAKAAVTSLDRHAVVIGKAEAQKQEEVDVLRKLPGAETPTDPARRAQLCASLGKLRHDRACRS